MREDQHLHCVGCGVPTLHRFSHLFSDRVGTVVWHRCTVCEMPRSSDLVPGGEDLDVDVAYAELTHELGGEG